MVSFHLIPTKTFFREVIVALPSCLESIGNTIYQTDQFCDSSLEGTFLRLKVGFQNLCGVQPERRSQAFFHFIHPERQANYIENHHQSHQENHEQQDIGERGLSSKTRKEDEKIAYGDTGKDQRAKHSLIFLDLRVHIGVDFSSIWTT